MQEPQSKQRNERQKNTEGGGTVAGGGRHHLWLNQTLQQDHVRTFRCGSKIDVGSEASWLAALHRFHKGRLLLLILQCRPTRLQLGI
jgi:hypothetical protein